MAASLTEATATDRPITRADIESKLREIRGEVEDVGNASKGYVLAAGIVALTAVVAGAYLLGRRKGRRRTTVVEVRRV
ncbi:MAG TPA: hypothetical protein VM262_18000 [Acidimicrobiales bacterium]|nr:hypothetical protein [Acidimicrobiales bacterium]